MKIETKITGGKSVFRLVKSIVSYDDDDDVILCDYDGLDEDE